MEHGELGNRLEGLATGLVDENALVRDRRHHIVLEEVTNETAGSRLVDVRRRDARGVAVLYEQFSFELLVVGTRVVEGVWTSHGESRRARCRALHGSRR